MATVKVRVQGHVYLLLAQALQLFPLVQGQGYCLKYWVSTVYSFFLQNQG